MADRSRFIHRSTLARISTFVLLLLLSVLGSTAFAADSAAPPDVAAANFEASYRLGAGDKVRLIVFGEDNLSGEFTVDSAGSVALPLIGNVAAGGKTLSELQTLITTSLKNGYLKDPRVSVEVLNYRPFYIIGEVNKGGEYPYQAGLTVLNAVAIAGGYTFRADTGLAVITRGGKEMNFDLKGPILVYPGDVVKIPERFF